MCLLLGQAKIWGPKYLETELCETEVHTAEVFWFVATLITIQFLSIGSADVSSLFKYKVKIIENYL